MSSPIKTPVDSNQEFEILSQISSGLEKGGSNQYRTAERLIRHNIFRDVIENYFVNFKPKSFVRRVAIDIEPTNEVLSIQNQFSKIIPNLTQGGHKYVHNLLKKRDEDCTDYEKLYRKEVYIDNKTINCTAYEVLYTDGSNSYLLPHLYDEMRLADMEMPNFNIVQALKIVQHLIITNFLKKFRQVFIPLQKKDNSEFGHHIQVSYHSKEDYESAIDKIYIRVWKTTSAVGVPVGAVLIF